MNFKASNTDQLTLSNPFKKTQMGNRNKKQVFMKYVFYICNTILFITCIIIIISKSSQIKVLRKGYQENERKLIDLKMKINQIGNNIQLEEKITAETESMKNELITQYGELGKKRDELLLQSSTSTIETQIKTVKYEIQLETILYNRLSQETSDLETQKSNIENKEKEYKRELEALKDKYERLQVKVNRNKDKDNEKEVLSRSNLITKESTAEKKSTKIDFWRDEKFQKWEPIVKFLLNIKHSTF